MSTVVHTRAGIPISCPDAMTEVIVRTRDAIVAEYEETWCLPATEWSMEQILTMRKDPRWENPLETDHE